MIKKNLKIEIDKIEERARFITDVLKGKIKVVKVKQKDLQEKLIQLKYKNLDLPKQVSTFDLTHECVKNLENKVKEHHDQLKNLENTSPGDLWRKEINEYLDEYKRFYKLNNLEDEMN